MSAPAVAFADRRQVVRRHLRGPRVGPHRDLRPKARQAHRHAVGRLREQRVWDELVVPLQVVVRHVEPDHAALRPRHPPDDLRRLQVPLVQRLELRPDLGLIQDRGQALPLHPADDLLHDLGPLRGLDYQRQLHRRLAHRHRLGRARIKRAVDDLRPVHQLGQIRSFPAVHLARDPRNEARAGAIVGVEVEPLRVFPALVVRRILRAQKRALVMVEPPRQLRAIGVFEIDDRIDLAVKQPLLEQLVRLVRHARID